MKLSVIIVNYNVRYFVEQCIHSVLKATKGITKEIIVVDNHSSDGSVEYLENRFGNTITIIDCSHNQGFARANNIAIRQSKGQYVLLLNPDTFVGEKSIRMVLDFMDGHPQAGAAGCRMYNANGTLARESRRGLPTPFVSFLKMLGASKRYYMSHLPWDQPARIDVLSGAFMMLRRQVLDHVGLLDEDFFMYGEDIDLSYRILKAGYENWYVPARIVHYKGESTQKTSFRYVHVFYQAMLIFFRKHYGHLSIIVTLPIKVAIYFRAILALLQMQYTRMRKSLGFYMRGVDEPLFFQGGTKMLKRCNQLARRKGLLVVPELPHGDNCCIVYDTDKYSYEDIISRSIGQAHKDIGTFNSSTGIIITQKETII